MKLSKSPPLTLQPPPLQEIYREGKQKQVHFSTNWVIQDMPHPIGLNWCESLWCLPWVLQQRSVCRDNDINLLHVAELLGPHQPTDSDANLQTQAEEGEGGQTAFANQWAFCDCFQTYNKQDVPSDWLTVQINSRSQRTVTLLTVFVYWIN